MCGFVGAINYFGSLNHNKCIKALGSIEHRGPDDSNYVASDRYFLGHQRLSIIDLSDNASQPFYSTSNSHLTLVYNGELYNYKSLRKTLQSKISFSTDSDTEVILNGYIVEGEDFFRKLRGIYAFAILNHKSEQVLLLRDPAGVKPLYLHHTNKGIYFGSEIKCLLPFLERKDLNSSVIKAYLNLGYCPEPYTIFKEIEAVKPGFLYKLSYEKNQLINLNSYDFSHENSSSYYENLEKADHLIKKAVERNFIADVPVHVSLSSGIDSSLIYAYSNQLTNDLNAISVSFNDSNFDESFIASEYHQWLNKGNFNTVSIDKSFSLKTLNKLLLHFDQPYADSSAIPVYFLSKAAKSYTKVLIGGDGGDELFNGYPSQTRLSQLCRLQYNIFLSKLLSISFKTLSLISPGKWKRKFNRVNDLWHSNPQEMLYDMHSWFPRGTKLNGKSPFKVKMEDGFEVYNKAFDEERPLDFDQQIVFDYFKKTMLSDYLRKTDMMSMLNGLEYRVPFLDEDLVRFALEIPFNQKSSLRETKKILRELHSNFFPANTSKLPKSGFSIPLDKELTNEEFQQMREILLSGKDNILLDYVSRDYLEFLFKALNNKTISKKHFSRESLYQRILMFYSLQLWFKEIGI